MKLVKFNNHIDSITKELPKEYSDMVKVINASIEVIELTKKNFCKSQSQFMDDNLTVSSPTPIRNIRQILAEIESIDMALKSNIIELKKKELKIEQKKKLLKKTKDIIEKELIQLDIIEFEDGYETSKNYIQASIRRKANYVEQYNSILNSLGKEFITELDFEKEEEEYHIKQAFNQAILAARSRGGVIDEGNFGYLNQLGINCGVAQVLVAQYLNHEMELISRNEEPTYQLYEDFLQEMYDKFKGSVDKLSEKRGKRTTISEIATLGCDKED